MNKIYFFKNELKIKYKSEEVYLLPKEFELLLFLYENSSQIFTREELLASVWPLESPTDRTIDDHIYRIRKKLEPLNFAISIETIRGKGYSLKIKTEVEPNPLLEDGEVSNNIKTLIRKYHIYGQGDALRLLEENQNVFGFTLDTKSKLYLRFMNGEFMWFLKSNEPFWEKCYFLLHIYSYVEQDKKKVLNYFTKSLSSNSLPPEYEIEIRLLNQITLMIFNKQFKQATKLLKESKQYINQNNLEAFIIPIHLTELYLSFLQGDKREINENMIIIEELLMRYPYSREVASFSIIKGINSLIYSDYINAKYHFDQGLEKFRQAKYIPGVLANINIILFFLKEFNGGSDELSNYFNDLLQKYLEEYKLNQICTQLEHLLQYKIN